MQPEPFGGFVFRLLYLDTYMLIQIYTILAPTIRRRI
jgi:hypothetical protein